MKEIFALYYLALLYEATVADNYPLPAPIRKLLIEEVGEQETDWLLNIPYSDLNYIVAEQGLVPLKNWADCDLLYNFVSYISNEDSYSELVDLNFLELVQNSISSLDIIRLTEQYHTPTLTSLATHYLSEEEMDLLTNTLLNNNEQHN